MTITNNSAKSCGGGAYLSATKGGGAACLGGTVTIRDNTVGDDCSNLTLPEDASGDYGMLLQTTSAGISNQSSIGVSVLNFNESSSPRTLTTDAATSWTAASGAYVLHSDNPSYPVIVEDSGKLCLGNTPSRQKVTVYGADASTPAVTDTWKSGYTATYSAADFKKNGREPIAFDVEGLEGVTELVPAGGQVSFVVPDNDVTLRARYAPDIYTVSFDSAGGSKVADQTVAEGECATKPDDPTMDGFEFAGWVTADGTAYDFTRAVTADLKLYATWSAQPEPVWAHMVVFDSAGGSKVKSQTVADGDRATKPDDPTWAGFTFEGWTTKDGEPYDFSTPVTDDLTLYATWSASGEPVSMHTVKFDTAGGSKVADQAVADGGTVTKPANPTWSGFAFTGWTTEDGEPYDFSRPVTGNLTLYATWSASDVPTAVYTVTFDTAGGSEVAAQTVTEGSAVSKPGDPTLTGFEFECWATEDGKEYDFATTVTGDLTLYARWSAKTNPTVAHLVVFDTAGGSEVAAQTVMDGGRIEKPEDPTLDGFSFDGWFTENGKEYSFDALVTDGLVLYAHWSKSGEPSHTDGGGDGDGEDGKQDGSGEQDDSGKKDSPASDSKHGSKNVLPATGDASAAVALASAGAGLAVIAIALKKRRCGAQQDLPRTHANTQPL